jgi:hypothetical protein
MATYYVQARKLGPSAMYQVVANSRAQALQNFATSAAATGDEYQVSDASTTLGTTGATAGTGPSGVTGSP